MRVPSRGKKRTTILRRSVTHLYPLEIRGTDESNVDDTTRSVNLAEPTAMSENSKPAEDLQAQSRQPRRAAAERAREWMQTVLSDYNISY